MISCSSLVAPVIARRSSTNRFRSYGVALIGHLLRCDSGGAESEMSNALYALESVPWRHKESMELRHLRYFAAVVDAGGVSKAALRLRMTQPALGRQIRDLEHELVVRLFDRVGRRVQLTAEGEELLRRARALLSDAESLVERGRALTTGTTGLLRVGSTPQTLESLLVPFMARFRRSHP